MISKQREDNGVATQLEEDAQVHVDADLKIVVGQFLQSKGFGLHRTAEMLSKRFKLVPRFLLKMLGQPVKAAPEPGQRNKPHEGLMRRFKSVKNDFASG